MSTILPLNPILPDVPKTPDGLLQWAQDFSKAFVDIYTRIARRAENATMEGLEIIRPGVQGVRRIYIPDDVDQVDFERTTGWFSVVGLATFLAHINSPIVNGNFVNFKPAGDITTASTTYVAIDSTNFKVTLTTEANKTVLLMLCGGSTNESGGANVIHMDVDVDGDILGGSGNGIIQVSHANPSSPVSSGIGFASRSNLSAASHVFTPVWRATANTGVILGAGSDLSTMLNLLVLEFKHGNA